MVFHSSGKNSLNHSACQVPILFFNLLAARSKTRHSAVALVAFGLEKDLAPELLRVLIEPNPELALPPVDVAGLQLDCDSLVWLSGDDEVLEVWVGLLHTLLVCAHDTDLWGDAWGEIWELELEQQPVLARVGVTHFGDAVSRAADLDDVLLGEYTSEQTLLADVVPLSFSLLFRSTTRQVCLVLPSLCVSEI